MVRESDKREEIYFEKGQTKQLVEQWKNKQISPDRETNEGTTTKETELLQQGKAKNLLQMWKCIDQENTPPSERRGPRPITPPIDTDRRFSSSIDVCLSLTDHIDSLSMWSRSLLIFRRICHRNDRTTPKIPSRLSQDMRKLFAKGISSLNRGNNRFDVIWIFLDFFKMPNKPVDQVENGIHDKLRRLRPNRWN